MQGLEIGTLGAHAVDEWVMCRVEAPRNTGAVPPYQEFPAVCNQGAVVSVGSRRHFYESVSGLGLA